MTTIDLLILQGELLATRLTHQERRLARRLKIITKLQKGIK